MKKIHAYDVPTDIVREPGAKQVTIRRLIDTPDGADRFLMSLFELGENGPHGSRVTVSFDLPRG